MAKKPEIEYPNGSGELDYFNEDEHNEQVVKQKSKKGSSWLNRFFASKPDADFNPVLLSDDEYITNAKHCFEDALSLLDGGDWKDHKTGPQDGDIVQYCNTRKFGKVFRLTGMVNYSAEALFKEFTENFNRISEWNPTILKGERIRTIDNETDITYQVTAGGGGGAVKPRDFVTLRYTTKYGDRYITSGISIDYPGYPPTEYIRGENKVGCWSLQKMPNVTNRTKFQWLMGCDLKGWIPQYVIDVAMHTVMFEYLEYLRKFIEKKTSETI